MFALLPVCLKGRICLIDDCSERRDWMVNCVMAHVDDFGVGVVAAGMYASVLGEGVEVNGIAAAAVAEKTMEAARVVIPSQP